MHVSPNDPLAEKTLSGPYVHIRAPSGTLKAVLAMSSYHRKLTLSFKAVVRLTIEAAVSVRSCVPSTLRDMGTFRLGCFYSATPGVSFSPFYNLWAVLFYVCAACDVYGTSIWGLSVQLCIVIQLAHYKS